MSESTSKNSVWAEIPGDKTSQGVVFGNFVGNFGVSQIPKNFNPELISKDLELPEGRLSGVVGWVLYMVRNTRLGDVFAAKSGVKT